MTGARDDGVDVGALGAQFGEHARPRGVERFGVEREGGLDPPAREHVEHHPHAHVLTRNVGTQPSVKVETLLLEIHPGDLLLLSSDGLNPAMHPPEHVVDLLDSTPDLAAPPFTPNTGPRLGSRMQSAVRLPSLRSAPAATAIVTGATRAEVSVVTSTRKPSA